MALLADFYAAPIAELASRIERSMPAWELARAAASQVPPVETQAALARFRADPGALAALIDHTLLKPEALPREIDAACAEARELGCATVCVHSSFIPQAARALAGSLTQPIAVVGFPHGASLRAAKATEARLAVEAGAREIDMVLAIGRLRAGELAFVHDDIQIVVEAAGPAPVKVILETSALSTGEKIAACVLARRAGAAFVKTSTGFGSGGATVEDVALMRAIVGPGMGVKASGGIRTLDDALRMVVAGASRLGASAGRAIVQSSLPAATPNPARKSLY